MDRQTEKRLSDRAVAIGREGQVAAFPELLDMLRSSSANVRRLSASALGKLAWLGVDQAAAVAALAPIARRDPHAQTRQYAIKASKAYGAAAQSCLHDLRDIAANADEKDYLRRDAASAVEHIEEVLRIAAATAVHKCQRCSAAVSSDEYARSHAAFQRPFCDRCFDEVFIERRNFETNVELAKTVQPADGTVVQSEGERRIAEWLTAHGVTYRYDAKFRIVGEFQIRPDFYLPELDVYVEYWGLETPQYKMSMYKKQTLYQQEGKKLVSVFPKDLPVLGPLLSAKLNTYGFTVPPSSSEAKKGNAQPPVAWPLSVLFRPPATFPAPEFSAPGVQALFYESVTYRGKPTRVFAWMGVQKLASGQTCPGVVLLHGGGGTALDEWVRLWNARGYAAIAMDQCGCVPGAPETRQWGTHARHAHGGPAGWDDSFDRTADSIEDQWPYHAVAAGIAGHSLLAAQTGVDAGRIGITGISWGGYATCIAAAIDSRLRGAVPVYGCGFLGHDSGWSDGAFRTRPADQVRRWLDLWDPSQYLPHARLPMCWVSGTNDAPYPLSILQKSYQLPTGPRSLCIRVDMGHSHPHGWAPAEIGVFMDSLLRGGEPLPRLRDHGRDGNKVWAVCESARPITKAELCCTRALGHWTDRKWNIYPARFDAAAGRIEADLPPRATVWFLNVFDDRDCVASTRHEELELP
jgi:dienelactone hydrolase